MVIIINSINDIIIQKKDLQNMEGGKIWEKRCTKIYNGYLWLEWDHVWLFFSAYLSYCINIISLLCFAQ